MGFIMVGAYKPNPDKTKMLADILETHVAFLRQEGFITDRKHILMQANDDTFIEIYEWKTELSHKLAAKNPVISSIWGELDKICTYIPAARVPDLNCLFSELVPRN